MAKKKPFTQGSIARGGAIGAIVVGGAVAADGIGKVCSDPSDGVAWMTLAAGTIVLACAHTFLGRSYRASGYRAAAHASEVL